MICFNIDDLRHAKTIYPEWVFLLGDKEKNPKNLVGKWKEITSQSTEELETLINKIESSSVEAWNFGPKTGLNNLATLDFDWEWVYYRWKEKFGERTNTLTFQTPNKGYRVLYNSQEKGVGNPYKESLHTEFLTNTYVAVGGYALDVEGTKQPYIQINNLQIKQDNNILQDTKNFLAELQQNYAFLGYKCVREQLTKHIKLDHNQRKALLHFMLKQGFLNQEIHDFYSTIYEKTGGKDYTKEKTQAQIISGREYIEKGGLPHPCKPKTNPATGNISVPLYEIFTFDPNNCRGCRRKSDYKNTIPETTTMDDASARRFDVTLPPRTLEEVKTKFKEWLEIVDKDLIDIVLAIACERMLPGDPVWMFLVAPSGGTKTELLRSLQGNKFYQLDNLTNHTLISGKIEKDDNGNMVPIRGILADMNNKITVLKDFTTILQKPNEERDAIFAQFRAAYDGYVDFAYGTAKERIKVHAKFGLVAGVTPIIEIYQKLYALLGERFLTVRHKPDPKKSAIKAMENLGSEDKMRSELAETVGGFLQTIKTDKFNSTVNKDLQNKIANIADAVAKMRAPVIIKTWNYIIQEARVPTPETPTRLSKQLCKITQLLALIRGHTQIEDADVQTMQRIAQDCCIPNRLKILKAYNTKRQTKQKTREIAEETKIPLSTCWHDLTEMQLLGLVEYSKTETEPDTYGRTRHLPDEDGWRIDDQDLFNLLDLVNLVSENTPSKEVEIKREKEARKEDLEMNQRDSIDGVVCETEGKAAYNQLRRLAPSEGAEKCELCGNFAVEYLVIMKSGEHLRRCQHCVDSMRVKGFKFEFAEEACIP